MTTVYANVLFIYLQIKYLVCSHRYSQYKIHIYGNSFLFHPNLLSTARILGFFRCHTKCPQMITLLTFMFPSNLIQILKAKHFPLALL